MIYYIIAAISFTMMFYMRYVREIVAVINQVCEQLDIDKYDFGYGDISYSLILIVLSLLFFPLFALTILFKPRAVVVKAFAKSAIENYFGLIIEEEDDD